MTIPRQLFVATILGTVFFSATGCVSLNTPVTREARIQQLEAEASEGNGKAMEALGDAYLYPYAYSEKGLNLEKALVWYPKAIKAGRSGAAKKIGHVMCELGDRYCFGREEKKDIKKALEWYTKAANAGDAFAMIRLGFLCENDDSGLKNETAAFAWYEKAAFANNFSGMDHIARMYADGRGVAKDEFNASIWHEKAVAAAEKSAKTGNLGDMRWLGHQYFTGAGKPRDAIRAYAWFDCIIHFETPLLSCSSCDSHFIQDQIDDAQKNRDAVAKFFETLEPDAAKDNLKKAKRLAENIREWVDESKEGRWPKKDRYEMDENILYEME